jgi:hypothetical protein
MRRSLALHPHSRCFAAAQIEVAITRPRPDNLMLSYTLTGKMNDILMPPVTAAARGEALWHHTCFEAFVRASSGAEYYEFNFSPSTQWAAYRFTSYRAGMCVAAEITAIPIETQSRPDSYTLQASLELSRLSGLPRNALWRLGLSAVIEDTSGDKSYWALAHPPGKPDFHHTDCFGHEFSPSGQT